LRGIRFNSPRAYSDDGKPTSRVAVGGRALLGSSTGLAAYPLVQLLHAATPATAPPLLQLALCLTRTSPELLVTPAPAPQLHRTVSDTNS
jgi:hypothetical protein